MSEKPKKAAVEQMKVSVIDALRIIDARLNPEDREAIAARARVESFIALSIRVLGRTNLSRIREEWQIVEIAARHGGKAVIDD